jgi:hypothetical protein
VQGVASSNPAAPTNRFKEIGHPRVAYLFG